MYKFNYNIQYSCHLILSSRYKFFINLLILVIIYSFLYGNNLIYCMNENNNIIDIPAVAESKETTIRPSEQIIAIRRNIQAYAHTIASHMEERDQIIEDAKQEITNLNTLTRRQYNELSGLREENTTLLNQVTNNNKALKAQTKEITRLTGSIEGGYTNGLQYNRTVGYKGTITKLEKEIADLRRDLHITNTLLAEAKTDKDRLYSLVGEALKKR